jgi:26S proteasome regulatory subunit T3
LQRQLEFLEVQEEYVKTELKNLKKEMLHAQEEIKRIQSVPLVIGQFLEAVDQNTGIVGSTTGTSILIDSKNVNNALFRFKLLCSNFINY